MMKNSIFTIVKKEFTRFFGDKRLVFTTILMPGIVVYVMYTLVGNIMKNEFTSAENFVASGYVQNMPLELESMLKQLPVEWRDVDSSEVNDIKIDLAEKEADLLVLFPDNFMENMSNYDVNKQTAAPNIEIYYNSGKPESAEVNAMLNSLLINYESSITNRFDINGGSVDYDLATEQDTTGQVFSLILPMLLMSFSFSSCISVAPESIAGEKERGTIATLLVTPMKRSSFALGKIISLSSIALLSGLSSFTGTMLSMPGLLGAANLDTSFYTAKDYALLLGVILSTVLLLVSLISVISAFSKSIKEATTICSPLNILTIVVSLVPMLENDILGKAWMFCIPFLNSVLCMNSIFSFKTNIIYIVISIISNILYTVILTFLLTRIFNSEKAMFSK